MKYPPLPKYLRKGTKDMNPYQKKLLTQARKYWNKGETAPSDLALKIMAEGFDFLFLEDKALDNYYANQ